MMTNQPPQNDHIERYRAIWKELHSTPKLLSFDYKWKKMMNCFDEVKETLGMMSTSCGCYEGAISIVNDVILYQYSNINKFKEKFDFFIWLIHNEVNFKLNKPCFFYDNLH